MRKSCFIISLIIMMMYIPDYAETASLFLDDWGVSPGSWTPSDGPSEIYMTKEDYTAGGTGFVGPGWGGQPFDAEAAYIGFLDSKVYIALVTGLPQEGAKDPWRYDNGSYNYYDWNRGLEKYWYDPGDIGIDLGADGSYEYAITTRINNDKSSYAPTPGEGMLLSGNLIWENPKAWDRWDESDDWGGISDPWAVNGYDNAVDLGSNFSYSAFGGDHFAIEAVLDISLFGLSDEDMLATHWVMECGNDNINLSAEVPSNVPEPSTMLLLGSGLAGLGFYRRKKIK